MDKYKFTEKERDAETNLDYFGARYYNSRIGLWLSVDPMADKYPGWSSYNYCLGNPMKYTDPNGDTVKIDPLLKVWHEFFYNLKDASGNYVNQAYKNQYDKLNASEMNYVVSDGALGRAANGTEILGNTSSDGKDILLTLDMNKASDLGTSAFTQTLSHEFGHCLQFEKGLIGVIFDKGQNSWGLTGISQKLEYDATVGQQMKPAGWSNNYNTDMTSIKTTYSTIPYSSQFESIVPIRIPGISSRKLVRENQSIWWKYPIK